MLQILMGETLSDLRQAVLRRIADGAAAGVDGQLLLVPEQLSHEMERHLCQVGGDTISRFAEVLSFSRLAGRVSSLYGGTAHKTLDGGGRLIAMAAALEAVASRLKLYSTGFQKPDFLLKLLTLVDELKSSIIRPENLRQTAARLEGRLALKLEELSLIQESYCAVCETMGRDPRDRLELLRSQLLDHDYITGRTVWLLGFTDFTGQELSVLEALLPQAERVCVALLENAGSLTEQTLCRLRSLETDQTAAIVHLPKTRYTSDALDYLRQNLFAAGTKTFDGGTDALHLHHSARAYGACLDVAGRLRHLAEDGYRYRDMAVCCTDLAAYRPLLTSILERYGIPAYYAGSRDILREPVIGMVLAALDAATGGMEADDVLRFLKTGLSPVSLAQCDRLERYVRTWRIRGKHWNEVWDMHPDGYGAVIKDETRAVLEQLNDLRIRAVGPLLRLRQSMDEADDTAAQTLALYDFLKEIDLAGTLERLGEQSRDESQLQKAQEYGQLFDILSGALEQLYHVLGKTVRKSEDFARLLGALLSQYEVGTIPASLDSVLVGDPAALRFSQERFLFILGAEDGQFPPYQSDIDLLTEQERLQLQSAGLPVSGIRDERMDRELVRIGQVLSGCTDKLYVNFCTDQPSHLFQRMSALFPTCPVALDDAAPAIWFTDVRDMGVLLARSEAIEVLENLPLPAVREAAQTVSQRAAHRLGSLSGQTVQQLYGKTLYLSASRIDQFAACRCAYFLNYGLGLKKPKEAAFDAPIYGTFVHAVLEQTARLVTQEGGFRAVSEERLLEIARNVMETLCDETMLSLLRQSERFSYLYGRNLSEIEAVVLELGRELRQSDFNPVGFEVEFSAVGDLPPVEIHGNQATALLSGFVDRVDLYTLGNVTYARVVDYKTGKKSFDYTDVLCGMGMQMLIYLFALEDGGEKLFGKPVKPAGVLYFPARRPVLTATSKLTDEDAALKRATEQIRKGLVLNDELVLSAMEHYEKSPVFLPFKINSKGELSGDLADRSELHLLRRHVERTLRQMADQIASGSVEPNPVVRGADSSPCDYCDYVQVCHRAAGQIEVRPMAKTSRSEFWTRLSREEEHHG